MATGWSDAATPPNHAAAPLEPIRTGGTGGSSSRLHLPANGGSGAARCASGGRYAR